VSAQDWGRGDTRRLTTRDFPREVLALVDDAQGGRFCVACRRDSLDTPAEEPLELDHKQPLSRGGDNNWRNLRWLCRSHNRGRCARPGLPEGPPAWARRLAQP